MRQRLLGLALVATLVCAACTTSSTSDGESPRDAATYNAQLGIAYMRQGNLAVAREKVDRALSQDPNNGEVQTAAGMVYDRLGDDKRADAHYAAAMRLQPDDPEVLNNYGVYLCRKGRTKEGERLFLKAARNRTYRTPELAYNNAGLCLRSAGQIEEAQKHFEQALALKPKFGDALLQLAEVNFERGRMTEAQALVQRYMGGQPANPQILWLGVRVERALGNRAAAEAYAKRLKAEYPKTEQTRALLNSERQG